MIELFGIQIGSVAQLISTGVLGAILLFIVRNRGLSLNAEEQIRKHFSTELERLAKRADESDERHEICERAKAELRRELEAMHREIAGLHRQIAQYSADKLMELREAGCPAVSAPHATGSAERVKKIGENGDK